MEIDEYIMGTVNCIKKPDLYNEENTPFNKENAIVTKEIPYNPSFGCP